MYKKLSMAILALTSGISFAGTMGVVDSFTPSIYLKVGSGGSWSMNTNLNVDPVIFDPAYEGYKGNVGIFSGHRL
jgi:hypothetical protein